MTAIHVYQSLLTRHWLADKHGTKDFPGSSRQGCRELSDTLTLAWRWVAESDGFYDDVVVQR